MNKFLVIFYTIILFTMCCCIKSCDGATDERLGHSTFYQMIEGLNSSNSPDNCRMAQMEAQRVHAPCATPQFTNMRCIRK